MSLRPTISVSVGAALSLLLWTQGASAAPTGHAQRSASSQDGARGTPRDEQRPTLRAGRLPESGITLDGILSEPVWATAPAIDDLRTIEPREGEPPTGKTIVRILTSATEIVIGVLCNDPDPSGIVSNSKARDAELDDEDHVAFVIDTYRDERSGYVFVVNPSGTRFDGIVTAQGSDVNSNWDAVWEARTARDANGWSAEIRIPIKSLGFKPGLTAWGLNVERRIERLQETSRWAGASRDYEIFQMSRAGLLTDLPAFDVGLGLTIRPALTLGAERLSPNASRGFTGDLSLDVTKQLGANLISSLTVNTDFAETEVDVRQTNLTRFEIVFPEKRSFFLEGADIFEFGMGLENVLVPFFSRRIGLTDEGVQIPINAGTKVNGRVGNTNVGALVVNTRDASGIGVGATTMGAARIKQNIFDESSVGLIATYGDQLDRPGSWLSGGDYTYQTSQFRGDKNLLVGGWALASRRDSSSETAGAFGWGIQYPNDLWQFSLSSARIGDEFDPALAFLERNGVSVWQGNAAFKPRPNKAGIRQMTYDTSLFLVNDLDGQWQSYNVRFKPFDWHFDSGDRVTVGFSREGDRPDEDFAVFESEPTQVIIPAASQEWKRYSFAVESAPKRPLSADVSWESGGFYGGDLDSVEVGIAIRQSLFKVEFGVERHSGRSDDWSTRDTQTNATLPGGRFTQRLYNSRIEVKFSPDLQLSTFLQYDNESASFGTNARMRWTFHPFGDLFVVYNHNLQRAVSDTTGRRSFEFASNALLVKLQYAWRP